MNYRTRCNYYVFTVKNTPESELFFKELRRANRRCGNGFLFRMGRNRNRKSIPIVSVRKQGRVPIKHSDRWDLYCKVKYTGDYTTWNRSLGTRTDKFIREAGPVIFKYRHLIEYANGTHKSVFEHLLAYHSNNLTAAGVPPLVNPANRDVIVNDKNEMTAAINLNNQKAVDLTKVQISPEAVQKLQTVINKVMNTTSTWKVTLKAEIDVHGDTHADLVRTLRSMGFGEKDLVSYEKLDLHRDLPLVQFGYPEHGNTYSDSKLRKIRVTKMDSAMVEGFEGDTWKKFLRNKIVGRVEIVEIPQKG